MAAKRSPILGYNHNVRYRGIVFHVQTEDSGIINPHVFTHLFHGGVIISTRKLVYDPGATEETVKSLMQAQHKAVMKDLKNLVFDDKIDQYLAGTAGLLPRGAGAEPAAPVDVLAEEPTPPAAPPPAAPAAPVEVDVAPTIPVEILHDAMPLGRAPTERVGNELMMDAELPPAPPPPQRTEISAAMAALQVDDDELAAAGLVEVDDVAEVHSPALPSAPPPPGAAAERPGQYSVTKRTTGVIDAVPSPQRPPIPAPRAPTPTANKIPAQGPLPPRAPTPPVVPPRAPTPSPISRPTPTSIPRLNPHARPADPALPPTPPSSPPPRTPGPPIPRPTTAAPPPRGRPSTGGGVVVSRPPVIVGGPSKTVGGPAPATQGKIRRAKETEGGIGGDLISERSLDEVILAYLSEDTSDE